MQAGSIIVFGGFDSFQVSYAAVKLLLKSRPTLKVIIARTWSSSHSMQHETICSCMESRKQRNMECYYKALAGARVVSVDIDNLQSFCVRLHHARAVMYVGAFGYDFFLPRDDV